ncbi:MAG TPA: peptidylprolyl isomerase [Bryobacteraceae bacterium]|nr:peptidylprolyl isomerase [Bryobacteraceae bacterium]
MKSLIFLVFFLCAGAMWAQSAPAATPEPMPNLPDQTVIAVFDDGTQLTMGEFKKLYAALPTPNQQLAMRDRKAFLESWAFMRKLALMAEKEKLDQQSPTKEALAYYRMFILSQAKINDAMNATTVEPAEILKYYNANKDKFKQVKVKAIYVAFRSSSASGGKGLTEAEAKAKAEKLLAELRKGADFATLVRQNSDDETSRNKGGDFATLNPTDNIPDAIRTAVFALKQGEVSEPVRQPGGFYLLRADEITYRPLSQVRDSIFSDLKQEQFKQWLDQTHAGTKVDFPNSAFFNNPAPAGPAKQ